MYLEPSLTGDLGPGVYATDTVLLDPQVPGNAEIIAEKLNMKGRPIETYLDFAVNAREVITLNGAYKGLPDQTRLILYNDFSGYGIIHLDNDMAIAVHWGPSNTTQQ